MTDYPKSREELMAENDDLRAKIAGLEKIVSIMDDAVKNRDAEIAALRRKKPPHVLSDKAADRFKRPAFSNGRR